MCTSKKKKNIFKLTFFINDDPFNFTDSKKKKSTINLKKT